MALLNYMLIQTDVENCVMQVEEICDICSVDCSNQWGDISDTGITDLNKSQAEAILGALTHTKCDHKPSVELIWGPPGTGKTKTVSTLLFRLVKMNLRTLVCAPTNVAITEVASRVHKLLTESNKAECPEYESVCSYGDLLLFGSKDRLKIGSNIEEIYLDYRVDRLTECLGPLTGWKHCFSSMISLLDDCVSQYNVFVENELIKSKENNKDEVLKLEYKSFLEFFRDRYNCMAEPLQNCLLIFCSHLPKKFVGESNYRDMVTLSHTLDSLEKLLLQDNVVSEELQKALLHAENVEDSEFSLLLHLRIETLSVLKSLRFSLEKLKLPRAMNKESIKEFCFQRASIIFCTVSNSFKLRSVEMEPLKLLVIDEAAQLKECESCIPLQLFGVRHAILIGDECQLPATVKSSVSQ